MIVTLIGIGSDSLADLFEAAGIDYVRHLPQPGEDPSKAQMLEIRNYSVRTLAGILLDWLNEQPSRKVTVTRKDDSAWHAGGKSIAEVERLLDAAKSLIAIDMGE